jgi:hypothetical protein
MLETLPILSTGSIHRTGIPGNSYDLWLCLTYVRDDDPHHDVDQQS